VADVVAPTDFVQCLTSFSTSHGFVLLVRRQLELATKPNPTSLSPLTPFIGASPDQLTFKLG
jgi:hypothetical protein